MREHEVKVSALIPTYNRRQYVFRAIDSVLSQTVPVDEVIVVDDGSTDGSGDAIQARYGSKVRLIRQENTGVSGARLRAIREARGKWIAFLDSDDEWLPDRQREFLSALEKLPADVAWLFGDMRFMGDEGEGTSLFEKAGLVVKGHPQIFEDSLSVIHPVQQAYLSGSLIRRNVLLEAECFTAGLRTHEDLLAAFEVACKCRFAAVPSIVTRFYRTSDLVASSLAHHGLNTPDHYRALMLAFPLVMKKTGKKTPWAQYYAGAVRGLCKLHVAQQQSIRHLVIEQFRYGASLASVAFFCAAVAGPWALRAWDRLAELRKTLDRKKETLVKHEFQASVRAAGK
jgi:glycosyltransferase involved in cell wall biosynthesis